MEVSGDCFVVEGQTLGADALNPDPNSARSSDFNSTSANPAIAAESTSRVSSASSTASISSTSPSSAATAAPSSSSVNSTAIGVGVGVSSESLGSTNSIS